jgi:hypothetical protein
MEAYQIKMKNVLKIIDLLRRKEMKKILVFLCALLLGFGIIGSTPAGAVSMQPKGLPLCGGSWTNLWNVTDEIDEIEVFITFGNTDLGDPPLFGFNTVGWGSILVNPDYGVATGPSTSGLNFSTAFTAYVAESFTLSMLLWNDGIFIGGSAWEWDPNKSEIMTEMANITSTEGYVRSAQFPVPEPATMLLLGSGLIGLAALGRKKFFKK